MSHRLGETLLEIDGLWFHYRGGPDVLRGADLKLREGELAALVGPNGCGKSTLISLVSGIRQPCEGGISIGGRPLTSMSPRGLARVLAVLPQAVSVSMPFPVEQIVRMGRFAHHGLLGGYSAADRQAVQEALEQTETAGFRHELIGHLSGGEQRRVFLAKALAQEPHLLLLDEPTSSLDLHYQVQILSLIRSLHDRCDLTVLAVLHDLDLASLFFDRIMVLHEGTIVADGSPEDVLTRERIGEVYRVDVEVLNDINGRPRVRLRGHDS